MQSAHADFSFIMVELLFLRLSARRIQTASFQIECLQLAAPQTALSSPLWRSGFLPLRFQVTRGCDEIVPMRMQHMNYCAERNAAQSSNMSDRYRMNVSNK